MTIRNPAKMSDGDNAAPGSPCLSARLLARYLSNVRHGEIVLLDGESRRVFGQRDQVCSLSVTLHVHDRGFYADMLLGGSIGAGESFMEGHWSVSDLAGLVRIILNNRSALESMEGGLARLLQPLRKAAHWVRRNTRSGARRNIAAHYDLGNDFFALFLDPTMMYSCAIFESPQMSLHAAQIARLDRICLKLQLCASDHLLEIGSGWGGLALHAAGQYGCRVTTTTISQRQYELTVARVKQAGLQDRITVLQRDYRDLEGQYDKLVSIEMIEAIGHQYYDTYFSRCAALLKADGVMLLQAITIADQRYTSARDSVDFIQRYIFPGSCIPCVSALCSSIARSSDLCVRHMEDIGPHYATTLRRWHDNLLLNQDRVRALGYPDSFIRMWEFYLAYCEGGFEERALGDVQMLLAKPQHRGALTVPATFVQDHIARKPPSTTISVPVM